MYIVSIGFITAAIMFGWYPIASVATVIFWATWLTLSHSPREKHMKEAYGSLPSRGKFLSTLPVIWPENEGAECAICMDPFEQPERVPCRLPCKHTYCRPCLDLLFKTQAAQHRCPECQRNLFRTIPVWEYTVAKCHVCSDVVGIATSTARFAWDVVMLLRAGKSVFNSPTFVTVGELTGMLPALLIGYLPYFMLSERFGPREDMVYSWIRWTELSIQAPMVINKVWGLQLEISDWWTSVFFEKTPSSYNVMKAVVMVTETVIESATSTVTVTLGRGVT